MGRALFSKSYRSAAEPIIRSASPATITNPAHSYEKWSASNPFDPESDDFFRDAQFEAFITEEEFQAQAEARRRESQEIDTTLPPLLEEMDSSSSEGGDSDAGSPMAVGPDDPVTMLDGLSPNAARLVRTPQVWYYHGGYSMASSTRLSSSTTDIPILEDDNVVSLEYPLTPSTPFIPPHFVHSDDPDLVRMSTPPPAEDLSIDMVDLSPPPSTSPVLYNWTRTVQPPASPSPVRSRERVDPLMTNVGARMSMARLSPVRVRGIAMTPA